MQKKTKIALGAAMAGILALGGLAGAASAGGGWGKHQGMGGGMGRGHGMQMMERYDANKDGKLSQEEIDTNRTSWHGEFDGDKNASLSLDEFKALWLKARNEEMVREFQHLDPDGNGQVTLDEYKAPMASMVTDMDRNGDGFLSRDDHKGKRGEGKHGKRRHGMGQGDGQGMGQGMGQGEGMGMGQGGDAAPAEQQ